MTPEEWSEKVISAWETTEGISLRDGHKFVLVRVISSQLHEAVDSATKALREELKLADIASEQLAEQCARLNDEAIALEKRVDQAESVNRALMEALHNAAAEDLTQEFKEKVKDLHPVDAAQMGYALAIMKWDRAALAVAEKP